MSKGLPKEQIAGGYNWKGRTILVVEDSIASNMFFSAALKPTGATLLSARNGQDAVELFKENKVDIVLMDIRMPKKDGFWATREIKRINKDVPVIVQTAYLLDNEEAKSYEAGSDHFIAKPIKLDTLLSTIADYFNVI